MTAHRESSPLSLHDALPIYSRIIMPRSERNSLTDKPQQFYLEPADANRLAALSGQFDENLRLLEKRLQVHISQHGNSFGVQGERSEEHTSELQSREKLVCRL